MTSEKFNSDLGLGSVLGGYAGFLHYLQLICPELATMWQKHDDEWNSLLQIQTYILSKIKNVIGLTGKRFAQLSQDHSIAKRANQIVEYQTPGKLITTRKQSMKLFVSTVLQHNSSE